MAHPAEGPRKSHGPRRAVLLLQMGGPETLRDLEPFLYNLFSDPDIIQLGRWSFLQRPLAWTISKTRSRKMAKRYARIGGGSPIRKHTDGLARALEGELAARGRWMPVRTVFRYTDPRATDVLAQLDGVDELIALTLYPHYSVSTTGSSLNDLTAALARRSKRPTLRTVARWGAHPAYVGLLRRQLEEALARVRARTSAPVHLVASPHGIPAGYEARGDPYRREVEETFALVTKGLEGYASVNLGFQSKVGPAEWLRPYTDDVIRELAKDGAKAIVMLPLGFVSDHIETLYDMDITYREAALAAGVEVYERVPAFNDAPEFALALADILQDEGHLGGA